MEERERGECVKNCSLNIKLFFSFVKKKETSSSWKSVSSPSPWCSTRTLLKSLPSPSSLTSLSSQSTLTEHPFFRTTFPRPFSIKPLLNQNVPWDLNLFFKEGLTEKARHRKAAQIMQRTCNLIIDNRFLPEVWNTNQIHGWRHFRVAIITSMKHLLNTGQMCLFKEPYIHFFLNRGRSGLSMGG